MNKSFFKNIIYNITYKIVNVIFPLITTIIVTRALLPEGVGKVSSAQTMVSYFTLIAALGIPNYGTREIAKVKNKEDKGKIFEELFLLNFISTAICLIIYYLWILNSNYLENELKLYIVAGLLLFFNFINIDWFYQGEEQFKYIAVRSIIIKIIMLILTFFLIKDQSDYIKYMLIYCLGIGGNYIFNVINIKKYKLKLTHNKLNLKRHIKPVLILLASSIAVEIYSLVDITMLSVLCNSKVVGYYSTASKLVKVATTLITAIGGVLLPRLSLYIKEKKYELVSELINQIFNIMLYLIVPCGIGMIAIADLIVPVLFGTAFTPAIITVKLLCGLFFAVSYSNLFGIQILIASGEENKVLISTIIGACVNLILNFILIPRYAQNGAAIASVISEMTVTVVMWIFAKKYFLLKKEMKLYISVACGIIMMLLTITIIRNVFSNIMLKIVCSIILGGVSYLITTNMIDRKILFLIKKIK